LEFDWANPPFQPGGIRFDGSSAIELLLPTRPCVEHCRVLGEWSSDFFREGTNLFAISPVELPPGLHGVALIFGCEQQRTQTDFG
jgi:hypothetical protein